MKKSCKRKYQVGGRTEKHLPGMTSNLDQLIDWTVMQHNLFDPNKPAAQPQQPQHKIDVKALLGNKGDEIIPGVTVPHDPETQALIDASGGFRKWQQQRTVSSKDNIYATDVDNGPQQVQPTEKLGLLDPRRTELHPYTQAANYYMQGVTGVANHIGSVQLGQQEKMKMLEEITPEAYENMERYGLNKNPVFTKFGGDVGKYQVGGQAPAPVDKSKVIKEKYGKNPFLQQGRADWYKALDKDLPMQKGTKTKDALYRVAQQAGVDPGLLFSSAMEEGMQLGFARPDDISEAYSMWSEKNGEQAGKFKVDGFYNYGLDRFGEEYERLKKKGYLGEDFAEKFTPYDAINERNEKIKTAAFVDDESALMAKAAMMRDATDQMNGFYEKKGGKLSDKAKNFFTLAAYNGGLGLAQKMYDSYDQKGYLKDDNFMNTDFKPASYAGVYTNVQKRMQSSDLLANEGFFSDFKPAQQQVAQNAMAATTKPAKNTLTGEVLPLQMGGEVGATVEAEQGEAIQNSQGQIGMIDNAAPTHEEGGVIVPDVHRVLENTSKIRKDKNSKYLRLDPKAVQELTGIETKKTMSHAQALDEADKVYEEQRENVVKKINLASKDKKDLDKYAENAVKLNINTFKSIPTKEQLFENLFNHQETVKAMVGIETGDTSQFGGYPKMQTGGGRWDGKGKWVYDNPADQAAADEAARKQAAEAKIAQAVAMQQLLTQTLPTIQGDKRAPFRFGPAQPTSPQAIQQLLTQTLPAVFGQAPAATPTQVAAVEQAQAAPASTTTAPAAPANTQAAATGTPATTVPDEDIIAYAGDKSFKGNKSKYTTEQWKDFAKKLGFTGKGNKAFQTFLSEHPLTKDLVKGLHDKHGMPNGGTWFDGRLGHRWDAILEGAKQWKHEEPVTKPGEPVKQNLDTSIVNNLKQGTTEQSKFHEPLRWFDLASSLGTYVSALERLPENYNGVEYNQLRYKLQDPTAALNKTQADFNAATEAVNATQAGAGAKMANVANLIAAKYSADQQIIGNTENQNAQIKNNEITYNTQVRDRQSAADQQARAVYEDKVLTSKAKQTEQKLTALDSLYKTIAENKALNRNGNLVMKFSRAFDQYGDYNGYQHMFGVNPALGLPNTGSAYTINQGKGNKPEAAGGLQKVSDNTWYNRKTGKTLFFDGNNLVER